MTKSKKSDADELSIALKEVAFHKEEKEKLVTELNIANKELVSYNKERDEEYLGHLATIVEFSDDPDADQVSLTPNASTLPATHL